MPPHKFANKRTEAQRAIDLHFIESAHIRGKTAARITVELNEQRTYKLSPSQIAHDLVEIRNLWEARTVAKRDAQIQRELAGLDEQEAELWESWEKSKKETIKQVVEQRTRGGKGHNGTTQRVEKELKHGDPAYMRLILEVRTQRAKLLGLNAPDKHEHTGADGEALFQPDPLEALEKVYGPDAAKAVTQTTVVGAIRN